MPAADAPTRPHFQQLANLVHSHAAARGWPNVEFQAAFRTVDRVGEGAPVLEGNSVFWDSAWDADASFPDHLVGVRVGEDAWRAFLVAAFYSDLLRADAELLKISAPNHDMNLEQTNNS